MDAAALRPFARRFRAACLLGAALACGCATPAGGVGGGAHDAAPPVAGVRLRSTPAASSAAGAAGEAPEVVEAPPPIGDAEAVTIVDPEESTPRRSSRPARRAAPIAWPASCRSRSRATRRR